MSGLSAMTDRMGVCTKPLGLATSVARDAGRADAAAGRAGGFAGADGGTAGARRLQTLTQANWASTLPSTPQPVGKSQGAPPSASDTSDRGVNAREPW